MKWMVQTMMITGNEGISFAIIFSLGSFIVALIGLVLNARKQQKEDVAYKEKTLEAENQRQLKMTENFVKVNLKLDTFCDTMNQMVVKSDKTNEELRRISDRLIEDKLKIDDHESRLSALEHKVN